MDMSHLLAVGSFTVDAHDSMMVAFALVTGHDLPELRANALAADAHYVSRKTVLPPPPVVKLTPGLYPNPLSQGENLRLVLPDTGPAMVRFYNVLGRQLAEITVPISHSGSANVDLSALQDASGVLFYSIEAAGDRFSGKLLRLR